MISPAIRRRGARAVLVLLLAWAAYGAALELYRSWWLVAADPWLDSEPSTWRVGSGAARRIEHLARRIEPQIPPGSVVAVVSTPDAPREARVRALWLAYFLPRHDIRAGQPDDRMPADYWLTFGPRPDQLEGLEPIDTTAAGALYRVP
jgi:hypothetical protein